MKDPNVRGAYLRGMQSVRPIETKAEPKAEKGHKPFRQESKRRPSIIYMETRQIEPLEVPFQIRRSSWHWAEIILRTFAGLSAESGDLNAKTLFSLTRWNDPSRFKE
jgi:hypothetical protein